MLKLLSVLRDAAWMSPERARGYRVVILVCLAGSFGLLVVLSHGGLDLYGRPLGTDFVSFWTASKIALSGAPASVYDVATHWRAQTALFGVDLHYTAFFYPPVFLLLCLPLAMLPYFPALVLWSLLTAAACFAAVRALARRPLIEFLVLPALWINLVYGQNGCVTASLFAGATLALGRSPIVAGLCLGALIYKPHFLILVPFALIAGQFWRTLLTAGIAALALCLVSWATFGGDTWWAFLASAKLARVTLEQNLVGYEKMQSSFAAARLLGASVATAYALQAVIAVPVLAVLVHLVRRGASGESLGVSLAAGTMCASPFLLAYDLMLFVVPLAWLMREAGGTGFRPWEKTAMMLAFITPLISPPLALHSHISIAPIATLALFAVVAARILASQPAKPDAARRLPTGHHR